MKCSHLNLCSGQRPFGPPFWNIDKQSRWNPDIVADCRELPMLENDSATMIVIHHGVEHFGCNQADDMLRECLRILRPGGSLIVCVPDMDKLVKMWLRKEMDTQLFMTNVYGAWMGDESDRHAWGFSQLSLAEKLYQIGFNHVQTFDYRVIPGADIARDETWILAQEARK